MVEVAICDGKPVVFEGQLYSGKDFFAVFQVQRENSIWAQFGQAKNVIERFGGNLELVRSDIIGCGDANNSPDKIECRVFKDKGHVNYSNHHDGRNRHMCRCGECARSDTRTGDGM